MATKKNSFNSYIDQVGNYYSNLPAMGKGGREFLVTILPWAALIGRILGILGVVSSIGIFSFISPFAYLGGADIVSRSLIVIILSLLSSVLLLMAFSELNKKKEKGWRLAYYAEVLMLISNIVVFSILGLIWTLIVFYLLYQVRNYYK